MSNARRLTQGEDLATKLKLVMDRAFTGDLRGISNQRDGTPQEGIPLDRQRIGVLSAGDIDDDLIWSTFRRQRRTNLANLLRHFGQSSRTLRASAGAPGRNPLPGFLVHNQFAGMPSGNGSRFCSPFHSPQPWDGSPSRLLKFPRYLGFESANNPSTSAWTAIASPLWLVLTCVHPRASA